MAAGTRAPAAGVAALAAVVIALTALLSPAAGAADQGASAAAARGQVTTRGHAMSRAHAAARGHAAARDQAASRRQAAAARQPATVTGNARLVVGGTQLAGTGVVVNYPSRHAPPLPDIPASAFVIADAGTGQVLAAKDPHGEFAPASTLKVLTAITMIPLLNPGATVQVSPLAASMPANVVGLIAGHRYRVADLFRALLLISANDAAVALTEASGSFAKGMALINAEARELQAYDVVARMPNGLPAPGQVVSAYDEALIARRALSIPAFMQYDSTLAARFPVRPRHWVTLVNQNYLLTKYRGGIGGKIGWTVASEATYIGMARRNGVTLIVTVLHCTPLQEITSAEKLLNWGFAMDGKVRPVGQLVPPLSLTAAHPAAHPAARAARAARRTRALDGRPGQAAQLGTTAAAGGGSTELAVAAGLVALALAGLLAILLRSRRRLAGRGGHGPGG
ncbi:MAG: D-alanyl-D-alanine carboxypeptidase [Streptosporangiaceae bacterium]|jgi:D-alanyl-D-alanine carboxypeptidase (penicillin-binding protein 5/6)